VAKSFMRKAAHEAGYVRVATLVHAVQQAAREPASECR
jgi:hypothetical protein